jgi:hypothetical protein
LPFQPTLITTPGATNANSYVAVADCLTYAENMGLLFDGVSGATSTISGGTALLRATQWLDGTYRLRFMGLKVGLRLQPLEWPRYSVVDTFGQYVDYTTIPIEITTATCEAAIREYTAPGTLAPDLDRGGQVKSLKAGSVDIVYGANATPLPLFTIIDNILGSLLATAHPLYSSSVRG